MHTRLLQPKLPAIAALAVALVFCVAAWALPVYQDALFARYPSAARSLTQCVACHDDPSAGSLNPFGSAFLANGLALDAALEALDSDGDGATNGAELTASPATAPGDPNSKPGSVGATPAPPTPPAPPAPPTPPTPPTPPVTTDGPTLYANSCAACHGALASSSKGGATLARMQSAIAGNVGGMGSLSTLSIPQLQAIASALASVVPVPAPTCGSCHGLPPKTGEHGEHTSRSCSTRHGAGYSSTTVNPVTHNNGIKELLASIGWNATSRSCANSCHGKHSW